MFGECHAHALMNGVNYREAVALHREKANEEAVRQCLRAYQEAEVSFVGESVPVRIPSRLPRAKAPDSRRREHKKRDFFM